MPQGTGQPPAAAERMGSNDTVRIRATQAGVCRGCERVSFACDTHLRL
jgi:hypothetical protein